MPDRRETILAALFAAVQTVSADGSGAMDVIERNRDTPLAEEVRPALLMFDGNELASNQNPRSGKRKAPQAVRMQPAIYGYVKAAAGSPGNISADVNALIARVRKAVFNNDTFLAALGADDVVSQDSLVLQFTPGATPEADFEMHLNIDYSFNPASP